MKKSAKAKASFSRFLTFELILTVASAILAYFGGQYVYGVLPGIFAAIAALFPAWLPLFGSPTPFTVAFFVVAGVIWLGSNSLLFLTGLRKY